MNGLQQPQQQAIRIRDLEYMVFLSLLGDSQAIVPRVVFPALLSLIIKGKQCHQFKQCILFFCICLLCSLFISGIRCSMLFYKKYFVRYPLLDFS